MILIDNMNLKALPKDQYRLQGRYKVPLLYFYVCLPTEDRPVDGYDNLPLINTGIYLDGYIFYKKEQGDAIEVAAKQAVRAGDRSFFANFNSVAQRTTGHMIHVLQSLEEKKNVDVNDVEDFFQAMNDMEYPWWFSLPMSDGLEKVLRGLIEKLVITVDQSQCFFILEKPTPTIQQGRDLKKIKSQLPPKLLGEIVGKTPAEAAAAIKQADPDSFDRIEKHVKQYRWFGMMHFWGEPFSVEKAVEQLLRDSAEETQQQPPDVSADVSWLKSVCAEVAYWRQLCADICAMASYTAYSVLGPIGQQKTGYAYNLLMWLTPPEFIKMMQGNFEPDLNAIEQRRACYGMLQEKEVREVFVGSRVSELVNEFLEIPQDTKTITGNVAYPGKLTGRVKIIFSPDEIGKVEKGDILVANETTPDFLPALSRAAGIITDLGGISSHAAIISREFKIPCIVGTKIATRVLKDNDLVELDANRGAIKKV